LVFICDILVIRKKSWSVCYERVMFREDIHWRASKKREVCACKVAERAEPCFLFLALSDRP
jgi:hypothetical protein